jgi:hypothetical protein
MTPIRFSPSSLREGRWYEYLNRFALGGAATVFTGLVSSRYGAFIGGLFLAIPAIFCVSATLLRSMKSAASAKRVSPASAAGKWRPPSTRVRNIGQLDPLRHWPWSGPARKEPKSLCLLFADVDHFKLYNDLHGHQKGDECCAQWQRSSARMPFVRPILPGMVVKNSQLSCPEPTRKVTARWLHDSAMSSRGFD